jgi:hypothetical protein
MAWKEETKEGKKSYNKGKNEQRKEGTKEQTGGRLPPPQQSTV